MGQQSKEDPSGKPSSNEHRRPGSGEGSGSAFAEMIRKRNMGENDAPEPEHEPETTQREDGA